MKSDKTLLWQRKPVKAQKKGDSYSVEDGTGNTWTMEADKFEALFEPVQGQSKDEVKEEDSNVRR